MKYKQLGNKFFINVPTIISNEISYLDCYVFGYICKKDTNINSISENLEIGKYKIKKVVDNLKNINVIEEKLNKLCIVNNEQSIFYDFEKKYLYDRTYIPNIKFLNIKQNAIFWKLYKYSDAVEGMKDYYTIGTKTNIQKMNYEYLSKVLNFPLYFIKKSINHLKELQLIKTQANKGSFYFGIQPMKSEIKNYWHDSERNIENLIVDPKMISDSYLEK
jgi:hypothetical protein